MRACMPEMRELSQRMFFSSSRRTGLTTRVSGSTGLWAWVKKAPKLNSWRMYLKKFPCDHRENRAPAT